MRPWLPLRLLLGALVGASGWSILPSLGAWSPHRRALSASRMVPANEGAVAGLPPAFADTENLLAGWRLHLMLHVPAGCGTFPDGEAELLLRASGVSAIVTDRERGTITTCLPIVQYDATDELAVDGRRWLWLHGDRVTLLERAAALSSPKPGYVASLPYGGAASVSALRRSSTLAWQLHTTHRCRAVLLSWPELEAAADADEGGWEAIASRLKRMRNTTWTVIQGG